VTAADLVDEVAIELATWPGVHVDRRADGAAVVRYEDVELGLLYVDRALAEIPAPGPERDLLIEEGDAEPAEGAHAVSHNIRGPSDVTAVLDLFDRRYRDLRGAADPRGSEDPG
jgi:Luciferase